MTDAPQWMTPDDLFAYSDGQISVETIRHHCRAGHIDGAQRAGRSWVVPAEAGMQWVDRYSRYGSLRRAAGPDSPWPEPAATPVPHTPERNPS